MEVGRRPPPSRLARDWEVLGPRYRPLVILLLAAVVGIVLDANDHEPMRFGFRTWWIGSAACIFVWSLILRRKSAGVAAFVLLAGVSLSAAAWHDLWSQHFAEDEISRFAAADGGPACVEVVARESAKVLPAPKMTPLRAIPAVERSRFDVEVTAIRDGTTWRRASGHCQLTVDGTVSNVRAGDGLLVFGQLARTMPPLNAGEFDYSAFARADRRLVTLRSASPEAVTRTARGSAWPPRTLLDTIRNWAHEVVLRSVGPERAALASALLLGVREGLTKEETETFLVTGTVHLLVVSGLNVAILAMGLHLAMRGGWIGRRTGLALTMAIVVAYAAVSGAEPPVVRAAILVMMWCAAAWFGRRGMGFNSLAGAALIILVLNPTDLFRSGPQLSFLGVASLIWVHERWREFRLRHPQDRLDQLLAAARPVYVRWLDWLWRWNGRLVLTTLVAWLTALPLVLHQFHLLTPVTILICPAVWLTVTAATWCGFLALVFGGWSSTLGALFGGACGWSLDGLEGVVKWAESLPSGHVWLPGPPWWWVIAFYIGLVAVMLWGGRLAPVRWQVAALCGWVIVGFLPPMFRAANRDGLECTFIAVGHGTSVLLEGPAGETLLYDAGSLGSPESATRVIASHLWHQGIVRLDGIVLSHTDVDHYNAVPGLLERFRVGAVYVSPSMYRDCGFGEADLVAKPQAALDGPGVLRQAIERAGVPVRQIWAGDHLRIGPHVSVDVLHPPRLAVVGSDNANSITLAVTHAGHRVLLPGDLESPGLEDLMAEAPYDCDILLAPHHGSRRSDPPGFSAWSTPEWVVVSSGNVDVGSSVRSYQAGGAAVFQTNLHGTVVFRLARQPIDVSTHVSPGLKLAAVRNVSVEMDATDADSMRRTVEGQE